MDRYLGQIPGFVSFLPLLLGIVRFSLWYEARGICRRSGLEWSVVWRGYCFLVERPI